MKSPITGKEMQIIKEKRKSVFRKEEFDIVFHAYKCKDTGQMFEDKAFAELNYNQVLNKYREKHSIPFPDQIKSIREKYDVSQNKMSEILGFGVNTYRQYENGEMPSISNARLINMIEDPHEFKKAVHLNKDLKSGYKEKLIKRIDKILLQAKSNKADRYILNYLTGNCLAESTTGYKQPDLEKLANMIIYFSEKMPAWKTKLNKLLFYADFGMFKKTGKSISGFRYAAIDMGPVPNNFRSLYEYLQNKNQLEIEYVAFKNGGTGEKIKKAEYEFNPDKFTNAELEILENLAQKFEQTGSKEIIKLSHQEKGWKENQANKSIIDYEYGFDLVGV
jgi:putative zinc finger/helix-turn-helix YgiT family protein